MVAHMRGVRVASLRLMKKTACIPRTCLCHALRYELQLLLLFFCRAAAAPRCGGTLYVTTSRVLLPCHPRCHCYYMPTAQPEGDCSTRMYVHGIKDVLVDDPPPWQNDPLVLSFMASRQVVRNTADGLCPRGKFSS